MADELKGLRWHKRVSDWLGTRNRSLVLSYLAMRRFIGLLGLALPLVCLLAAVFPSPEARVYFDSISMYYYSSVHDVFVGIVITMGLFLITYHGHDYRDRIVTTLAGLAALGVALFPCEYPLSSVPQGLFQLPPKVSDPVHLTNAGLFFFLLAMMSIFLFTKTKKGKKIAKGSAKARQNMVYRVTGVLILLSIAAVAVTESLTMARVLDAEAVRRSRVFFWLESFMLLNFGVSWIVKGDTLRPRGRKARTSEADS